jgi:hypothetical protein
MSKETPVYNISKISIVGIKHIAWMTHTYNPSNLRSWDQEAHSSRPAWTNSLGDPIPKITRAKWIGSVSRAVECLLCECKHVNLSSSPSTAKKIA